jgi:putative ABC transport system permease protein
MASGECAVANIRQLLLRLASVLRFGRAEDDLAREVRAHLRLLEDQFLAQGMTEAEARLAARRAFVGGVEQAKEHQRDARSFRWLDDARADVVYAVRSLGRNPGFAIAAIFTLALGIGAATAISSVVDTVMLQPLPFPGGDRLVSLNEEGRGPRDPRMNYQEYVAWRTRTRTLSGLATASWNPQIAVTTPNGTARMTALIVSANYFELLGARAALGRTIVAADDANPQVAVLTFETWRRHYGGDPGILGKTLDARPSSGAEARYLTIVGVLPEHHETLAATTDFYMPLEPVTSNGRPTGVNSLMGRLRDDVSLEAAREEANALGSAIRPPRSASAPPLTGPRFVVERVKDGMVAALKPALRIFLAAVAVLLIIVCANVANLLLARGTARQREIAIRFALGASRGRIVRQILTECLVLAITGGAFGAAIGAAGVMAIKQLATIESQGVFRIVMGGSVLPRMQEVGIDPRFFAIAFGFAALACVLFGLLPALHLSATSSLRAIGTRGGGTARAETRTRTALIVTQLAMATVLLVGAGLLSRSFNNLMSVTKGYDPSHVLAFQLVVPETYTTARRAETFDRLLDRLRAQPAVRSAGFAFAGILVMIQNTVGTFIPPGGNVEQLSSEQNNPRLKSVSPGYLEAVGASVLGGRLFAEEDGSAAVPKIVINRSVARRYFGQANPVGSYMDWHGVKKGESARVEVIGVIDDVQQARLDRETYPEIFMDYRHLIRLLERWGEKPSTVNHLAFGFQSFAVRTTGEPREMIPVVSQTVRSVDVNAGIDAIQPLEQLVAQSVASQRFYAVMLGLFAIVAALLASVGIYGVLAYAVMQRTQEIGVRMALGAQRRQVLTLVLSRGIALAAIGIGIGLAGAAAGTRYLRGLLFGVTPLDTSTFALTALGFVMLAALASYIPARRATRVDPMIALRNE